MFVLSSEENFKENSEWLQQMEPLTQMRMLYHAKDREKHNTVVVDWNGYFLKEDAVRHQPIFAVRLIGL